MADNDQKTQDPTDKKLDDARRKGDLPSAPEMRHAVMFVAMLLTVGGLGLHMARTLAMLCADLWGGAGQLSLTPATGPQISGAVLGQGARAIGPLLAATAALAILPLFAQGIPTLSWHRLSLKWDRLSPLAGFKRLFGMQALVEFAKTLLKFSVVALVLGLLLWPAMTGLDRTVGADVGTIGESAAGLVARILRVAAMMVGGLALADLVWQRRSWFARMRMSLQEVKDEHKESEGDPHIKQRIRAIQMSRAQRRMMAAVPEASVILTNPTHYSVALKYDHGAMRAPVVVAKGADLVAFKIREVAAAANVPVIESPPLARALYASVPIDHPIPVEHYAAVAEIISYVLRLARSRVV